MMIQCPPDLSNTPAAAADHQLLRAIATSKQHIRTPLGVKDLTIDVLLPIVGESGAGGHQEIP